MEATNITRTTVTLRLSTDELGFLGNAINETLEALEEWEFQTRTGGTREWAMQLLAQIHEVWAESNRA